MEHDVFGEWRVTDATLYRTALEDRDYRPLDVSAAAETAVQAVGVRANDRDAYVVPLFDEDGMEPTDEYVLYRPEKDQVGWYDTDFGITGTERFADASDLDTTSIAHRLRGWLGAAVEERGVDVDEETLPPTRIAPTTPMTAREREDELDALAEFVRDERRAEREEARAAYDSLGLSGAISRGRAVGPFGFVGEAVDATGDTLYRYQFLDADEETSLRTDEGVFVGNRCLLDARHGALPVEVEVRGVDGPTVTVRVAAGDDGDRQLLADAERDFHLFDLLNPVPFQRRLDAIDSVREDAGKRDLLAGARPLQFDVNAHANPETGIALNEYQEVALLWADGAADAVCIHGPPGTGKTRTLTAYVAYAVSQGRRVLVTAHSNQAVDNLLVGDSTREEPEPDTLHALAQSDDAELSVARVGGNSTNRVVREHYAGASVADAEVVAATTNGAATFDTNTFDVGVVDEATQASRPATAIVLNCTRKLVLAGDHQQLPPYAATEPGDDETHASLFERLLDRYGDDVAVQLRTQYRMHEAIASFPNRAFYDDALETAERNRTWAIGNLDPLVGVDVIGPESRDGAAKSYYNDAEAEAVAARVERAVNAGVDPEDVGVISAYSAQVGRVRRELGERGIEGVAVDTVDSFQGGEREAIVVSFVRSNPENRSGFLEFRDEGRRRLNVALTRARKHLVLVGDWETLGTRGPGRSAEESCADTYASLAAHLRENGWMR